MNPGEQPEINGISFENIHEQQSTRSGTAMGK
jgi:hypothetical protein